MIARGKLGEHDAELESVKGERAVVVAPAAFPPGKPATLVLAVEPPLSIPLKAVGSKRRPDGRFEVTARIVGLRRAEREQLDVIVRGDSERSSG